MIPASNIRAVSFGHAEHGEVLFHSGDNFAKFLCLEQGAEKYALFLEGQYKGHAIPLDPDQPRSGFAVRGGCFEIDYGSAVAHELPNGSLLLTNRGPAIRATIADGNGFAHAEWLPVQPPEHEVAQAQSEVAFTRWRIVLPLADGSLATIFEHEPEQV